MVNVIHLMTLWVEKISGGVPVRDAPTLSKIPSKPRLNMLMSENVSPKRKSFGASFYRFFKHIGQAMGASA